MKKQILKELLRTEEKYRFSSADLLRAAPIWLVETQDSMDSLYHEMESLVRELVRKNIFRKGASTALELYSAFRQTESGVELGFQNTAGAYLPGYDQWMEYISGKLGVSNALIALHIRDTDPAVLNTDGLQRIWRCMSAYKAHCLTLVIVDKDNGDVVEKSFSGTYFCRKVSYVPMTKEELIQYFLTVMDQYKIDADKAAVRGSLKDLLKERSCSQKELSVLIQKLLWYLAVNEDSNNTDGKAAESITAEGSSSENRQSGNKKMEIETDETGRILSFLRSEEARRYFRPEERSERVIGFR
jgi:hypothetical protein